MFSASSGYKIIFDHVVAVNIVGDIKYVIIFQCFIIVDILTHNLPCVISGFLMQQTSSALFGGLLSSPRQ